MIANISGTAVSGFQLGLIMVIPDGCGIREVIGAERLLPFEDAAIGAGATSKTLDYRFAPDEAEWFRTQNAGSAVLTQLAVVSVQFSDGRSWHLPAHQGVYDSGLLEQNANLQCRVSSKVKVSSANAAGKCRLLMIKGGFPPNPDVWLR
jgi:hypothetical protein